MLPCIAALVTDLIFRTKIDSTARALGAVVKFAGSANELERLGNQEACDRIFIDLGHGEALKSIEAISQLDPRPRIIAFASHVETQQIAAARQAGADEVMARSAFSSRLAELLGSET